MICDNAWWIRPREEPRTRRTRIPQLSRPRRRRRLRDAGVAAAPLHVATERVIRQNWPDGVAEQADLTGEAGPLLCCQKVPVGGVGGGDELTERLLVARRGGGEQRNGAKRQAVIANA